MAAQSHHAPRRRSVRRRLLLSALALLPCLLGAVGADAEFPVPCADGNLRVEVWHPTCVLFPARVVAERLDTHESVASEPSMCEGDRYAEVFSIPRGVKVRVTASHAGYASNSVVITLPRAGMLGVSLTLEYEASSSPTKRSTGQP